MPLRLALTTLVVKDYDPAIHFYTKQLNFVLIEDTPLDPNNTKRWVVISPGNASSSILLAKADTDSQLAAVGNQTGGRVFLFLETDDFDRDYEEYGSKGVKFLEEPRREEYGTVAVFEDLYGNKWDLIEPARKV